MEPTNPALGPDSKGPPAPARDPLSGIPLPSYYRWKRGMAVAGIMIIFLRLAWVPLDRLWRDYALWLAVYATYSSLAGRTRGWPDATAGVMAFLLGLYVQGQWPHLLRVMGWSP